MVAETTHRIGSSGSPRSRVLHLPLSWCDGLGLEKGDRVDLVFDDVLVVIPRKTPQADRVRRAMAEVER